MTHINELEDSENMPIFTIKDKEISTEQKDFNKKFNTIDNDLENSINET